MQVRRRRDMAVSREKRMLRVEAVIYKTVWAIVWYKLDLASRETKPKKWAVSQTDVHLTWNT